MKLLTPDEKLFYKENGFIHLGNIFTASEVNELSEEYDMVFQVGLIIKLYLTIEDRLQFCPPPLKAPNSLFQRVTVAFHGEFH